MWLFRDAAPATSSVLSPTLCRQVTYSETHARASGSVADIFYAKYGETHVALKQSHRDSSAAGGTEFDRLAEQSMAYERCMASRVREALECVSPNVHVPAEVAPLCSDTVYSYAWVHGGSLAPHHDPNIVRLTTSALYGALLLHGLACQEVNVSDCLVDSRGDVWIVDFGRWVVLDPQTRQLTARLHGTHGKESQLACAIDGAAPELKKMVRLLVRCLWRDDATLPTLETLERMKTTVRESAPAPVRPLLLSLISIHQIPRCLGHSRLAMAAALKSMDPVRTAHEPTLGSIEAAGSMVSPESLGSGEHDCVSTADDEFVCVTPT